MLHLHITDIKTLQRYKPTVEIITSDLRTGLELGRTAWSGPGSLTLSTISSAVANNIHKRNTHYQSPLRTQGVPEDVEVFTVPVQYRAERQHYSPPAEVMGRPCRSQEDCSSAYRAVCAVSQECRVCLFQQPSNNYTQYSH